MLLKETYYTRVLLLQKEEKPCDISKSASQLSPDRRIKE